MPDKQERLTKVDFNIHKFTTRPKPSKEGVLILCCFSEFGCEVVGATHCIPRLLKYNPAPYVIVVGWYGRAYLYKHLADEFWEVKEEHQWLREYCRAFHHESKNLAKIEKALSAYGRVVGSGEVGHYAVGNLCNSCRHFWGDITRVEKCEKCGGADLDRSVLGDIPYWKGRGVCIPKPSATKMAEAAKLLGPNPIGVTARGREAYGRNLQPEFYVKLINQLELDGYTPIWIGEKQSTQACPVSHVTDFSRMPESRDLELTLALVSQCKFTIQYWTASTRLAALMGTPYLLFESPDQVYGNGQEGMRMELLTHGKKKLVVCHYLTVFNDHENALKLTGRCIKEMEEDNYEDVIGMVESYECVRVMQDGCKAKLGRI